MEEYTQRLTESSWDNKEWICSICGRQNKEEFKYCPECGEKKPDHEETQTEITIKKLKRKGFENCEQLFRLLIHVEDEEGNLLGSYNMTLHGYATKQELLNLLEDYLGYKENHRAPKKYHLEIQDWPYHSLDSAYETKEDFHVCELYSAEWNAVRKEYGETFFSSMKYKQLSKAIDVFYSDAFKPEFVNAFEFVDNASASINSMMKQGLFSTGTKASAETSQKYVEQSFQISLMKIRDGFEKAFMSVNLKKPTILFVDGIDARPRDIDTVSYTHLTLPTNSLV